MVSSHGPASCLSNPEAALGLQHDVEASPKGGAILNTFNPAASTTEAQVLVDATDAEGRCHDQGVGGLAAAPRGGLEILDVAELLNPTDDGLTSELGLTSHIGESHTVNIDPRRPHIAYSVTSDAVTVKDGRRQNELERVPNAAGIEGPNADRFDLDGFEVVDMSSCMYFPAGTSVQAKRDACRPQVFRYRFPTLGMSQGHTNKGTVYGCHELEVYPDDRLTCGAGGALIVLDMKGAFNDGGTPGNFTDDRLNGTPLNCTLRDSSTALPEFKTGAKVTDCVDGTGEGTEDLSVPRWLQAGAPSLTGVQHVGTAFHQGRAATKQSATAFPSTEDGVPAHGQLHEPDRLLPAQPAGVRRQAEAGAVRLLPPQPAGGREAHRHPQRQGRAHDDAQALHGGQRPHHPGDAQDQAPRRLPRDHQRRARLAHRDVHADHPPAVDRAGLEAAGRRGAPPP